MNLNEHFFQKEKKSDFFLKVRDTNVSAQHELFHLKSLICFKNLPFFGASTFHKPLPCA